MQLKSVRPVSAEKRQRKLLSQKIKDLELKITGTRLEALVKQLYRELENSGIKFKPRTYLSDEWGCPHGVPVIGIPFYLADPELCKLEGDLTGVEAETDDEIMMFLRHEAGHALNYALRLYDTAEWCKLFGEFSLDYREDFGTTPFSPRFVRHVPGWYAQKHPDDDFAETFAVWLTPGSNWEKVYAGTPALEKLLYVDRIVSLYGRKMPPIKAAKLDKPVQDLAMTLDTWYASNAHPNHSPPDLNSIIDQDLQRLFPATRGRRAETILEANRTVLIREINFWTGLERHILAALFDELILKAKKLGLKIEAKRNGERLLSAAVFLATLAGNYQHRGRFIPI